MYQFRENLADVLNEIDCGACRIIHNVISAGVKFTSVAIHVLTTVPLYTWYNGKEAYNRSRYLKGMGNP